MNIQITVSLFQLISGLLHPIAFTIGCFLIFGKFKVKRWWAFVPILNTYKLGLCVDREEDAKVFKYTYFFTGIFRIIITVLNEYKDVVNNVPRQMLLIVYLALCLINVVYSYRIFAALAICFGRPKIDAFFFLFLDSIMALFYGFSRKLRPTITHEDENMEETSTLSGDFQGTSKGLSVNIKSRTAGDGLKQKVLLKDIKLNIEPGNMVLLLGGSGAGKTTFLNAVTGYEKADADILIDGENVYERFDKLKYKIGFVPQQDLIRYKDTVYHTVADSAKLKLPTDIKKKDREARVKEVLDIFGLLPVKKNLVSKQSGGQKKRISIATEFVADPSVFILDEPDSGLDGIMARELMQRLHDISRQGKIVIVITHTPDRVIDLFDKVIVLAKDEKRTGRLVFYGTIDDAKKFFERDTMEAVVKSINRTEEGGDGRADELLAKYAEVPNE